MPNVAKPTSTLDISTEFVPGGMFVYYADGDEEILHANRYVIDLFECETYEEFLELTGGSFKGFVHEADLAATERNIWHQVNRREGLDHVFYRIQTKSGKLVSVDDYGRLVRTEGSRPVFYVFVSRLNRNDTVDWLTGLPELPHFKHVANLAIHSMDVQKVQPLILVFDIMGMKGYNARYGRPEGDKLLRAFANTLRDHFDEDACCRHAGDRFFVFTTAEGVADRVQRVFDEFETSGVDHVPPVMGGACGFAPGDDVSLVLDRARLACDSDRTTWNSHITWSTLDMRDRANMRNHILSHVDEAIERGWVQPYYQAVVDSATQRVCHYEALARWIDPQYGPLSPAQFIPVLEESGLLLKLDMHMIECVLEDFVETRERGHELLPVSVNVSLRDLGKFDLATVLTQAANAMGVSHTLVCVEFTESVAMSEPDLLQSQINALHAAGFEVWMDDFGSGYSSLNTLRAFDFDVLKLDMDFLRGEYLDKSRTIVRGIINIAKQLGMGTLAEGVETLEQVESLTDMGCDKLQGYYFARPMPFDALVADER